MSGLHDLSVLNVLVLLSSIVGFTWYLQWKLKRRHLLKLAARIPTPENVSCYPIIGHAHHLVGNTEKHIQSLSSFNSKSVFPRTLYMVYMVYHLLLRPEDLEIVFNSSKALGKTDLYRYFKAGPGYGLLNLDVKTWRVHRKIIMPMLNQKILNGQVPIFVEQARVMTRLMETEAGKAFNIFQFVLNCTLDCVFETSMGTSFHCQTTDGRGINAMITRGMKILMLRVVKPTLHVDFFYKFTSLGKEEKMIFARVNSIFSKGSETSATVASFTLTCIALFPEVQRRVYEEIVEVVGKDRDVEASDLPSLKYTEATIKESMRLFPVAPVLLRKLDGDLELETCTLAKGAGLLLNIFALHRHPLYYKDPLKFIPERFSPEEAAKRHPYSYLPFSAGPRNCIGLKYGMMLVKCILVSILRKYVVSTDYKSIEEIRVKQCLVIKPVLGFKVRVTPRED